MSKIKKFEEYNKPENNSDENIKEGYTEAEPIVAPDTITKPKKKSKPSPIRRDKPSVAPGPKAVEKLANRFLNLTKNDESVKEILRKKYNK